MRVSVRFFATVLLITGFSLGLRSQDIIHQRDNHVIKGKVLAINPLELSFRFNNQVDTILVLTDIKRIKYQIGYLDHVGRRGLTRRSWSPKTEIREVNGMYVERLAPYRSNYFHLGIGNLILGEMSMGYERLFDGGKIGLKLPVKFNLGSIDYGTEQLNEQYLDTYGLDLNFYPGRQGFFRFFTGMGVRFGTYVYGEGKNESGYAGPFGTGQFYSNYTYKEYDTKFRAIVFNAGVFLRPFKWLGFNAVLGIGAMRIDGVEDSTAPREAQNPSRGLFVDPQLNLTIGL